HRVRLGGVGAARGGAHPCALRARRPQGCRACGRGADRASSSCRRRGRAGGRRTPAAPAEEAQAVWLRDRARIVQSGRERRHTDVMRAVQYAAYSGPDVLELGDAPEAHRGPGEVRIAVEAAAVNPMDTKLRSGMFASEPLSTPKIPGLDAAGVVDELGEGVTGGAVGARVLGAGSATIGQYAVLPDDWPVPAG